eukprot:494649-Prorocentrum_minimum.AAC.1
MHRFVRSNSPFVRLWVRRVGTPFGDPVALERVHNSCRVEPPRRWSRTGNLSEINLSAEHMFRCSTIEHRKAWEAGCIVTGNSNPSAKDYFVVLQDVAERIGREGKRRHFDAHVASIDNYSHVNLPLETYVIFVTSTTGQVLSKPYHSLCTRW